MQVNVAQLLKATIGSEKNYDVDETVNIEGCDYTVRGIVNLMRTDHGILVEGKLRTDSELTCSRCLTLFDCPLTFKIEEEYLPTTDILSGTPLPVPDDPGAFMIDERNILDLTEAIRQYAFLAIPMKPLCRKDCAGLCPTCGANLNKGQCRCAPVQADPRWSKLRELLKNDSNKPVNNLKGRK